MDNIKELNEQLFNAVQEGDVQKVEALLEKGADINAKGDHGQTPLHTSSFWGHFEVMKLLLDKGADVNASTKHGNTPIFAVSSAGSVRLMLLLLDKGADVNAKDKNGSMPLHQASYRMEGISDMGAEAKTDAVKVLIEKGADVNAKEYGKFTPLHNAEKSNLTEAAELLRKKEGEKQIVTPRESVALPKASEATASKSRPSDDETLMKEPEVRYGITFFKIDELDKFLDSARLTLENFPSITEVEIREFFRRNIRYSELSGPLRCNSLKKVLKNLNKWIKKNSKRPDFKGELHIEILPEWSGGLRFLTIHKGAFRAFYAYPCETGWVQWYN